MAQATTRILLSDEMPADADRIAPQSFTARIPAASHQAPAGSSGPSRDRVVVDGKLFRLHGRPWYLKGFTYGPFPANSQGEHLPEREQLQRDFRQIRALGANAIRLYHPPGVGVLDEALAQDLRVTIDVPWEKHRCFFEDYSAQRAAREAVASAAKTFGAH